MKSYRKRTNHWMCSLKKWSYLAKLIWKRLWQSLFFNEVASLRPEPCNFIKKRLCQRCFSVNFEKLLRTPSRDCFWYSYASSCNINLSLQFVTINFTFSLLRVLTLASFYALMLLKFWVDLLCGRICYFKPCLQNRSYREIMRKHNIQKIHVHIFK